MRCIPLPYHPHLAPPLLSATVRIGGLVGPGNRRIQLHELCGDYPAYLPYWLSKV